MWYLFLTISFVAGVFTHAIIVRLFKVSGTLKIDHSNPDKDKWLFEIGETDIAKKKWFVLKIDHHADLSQK